MYTLSTATLLAFGWSLPLGAIFKMLLRSYFLVAYKWFNISDRWVSRIQGVWVKLECVRPGTGIESRLRRRLWAASKGHDGCVVSLSGVERS
jgi:hypothetical protein